MSFEKLLGGPPLHVAGRLLLISMIVGAALSFLGWDLNELISAIFNFIKNIGEHGWESIGSLITYALKGAVLVIPIWLISRLLGRKSD